MEVKNIKSDGFTVFFKEVTPSNRPIEYQFFVAHKGESGFNKTYTVQARPLYLDLPREVMMSGLGSGLTYTVKARAVNRVGTGKWSGTFIVTTLSSKINLFLFYSCMLFAHSYLSTLLYCIPSLLFVLY